MKKILFILLFLTVNVFACELLILNRSDLSTDSFWDRYDIVVIKPDSHTWGTKELDTGKFLLIKLPGVDASNINNYMVMDSTDSSIATMNRKYRIDPTQMSAGDLSDFNAGSLTTNLATLATYVLDKTQ